MLLVGIILALLIGLTLGLLGGGGSILALPMLIYVLAVEPKDAIASSLLIVGTTSLVGVVAHARAGRVRWPIGLAFGVAGMAGAFVGGRLAHFIPSAALLVAFGVMMLATSAKMIGGGGAPAKRGANPSLVRSLVMGAVVGLVAGMVGAGGGFLVVPALTIFAGLAMPEAVATSLLVIAMQSLAGFAGHAAHAHVPWDLVGPVAGATVGGSLVGVALAKRFKPDTLRKAFGWLVLAMGIFVVVKQLPGGPVRLVGGTLMVALAVGWALLTFFRARSLSARPTH